MHFNGGVLGSLRAKMGARILCSKISVFGGLIRVRGGSPRKGYCIPGGVKSLGGCTRSTGCPLLGARWPLEIGGKNKVHEH